MVYAYMFPVASIRVLDAYSPVIRGAPNAILFILNDTYKLLDWPGHCAIEKAVFRPPFEPDVEVLGDDVAHELAEYTYRTTRFKLGSRIDLLERCFSTSTFPHTPRKISVTFRSFGVAQVIAPLDFLYALLDLPNTTNIHIFLDPGYMDYMNLWILETANAATASHLRATGDRLRDQDLTRMLDMVFPLLELQEQHFTVTLLLEPKGWFALRHLWRVETLKQKFTYAFTPANAVWSPKGVLEKYKEV